MEGKFNFRLITLLSIFGKNICQVPSNRLQCMKLQLLKYEICVEYLPGPKMCIADMLSRNYLPESYQNEIYLEGEICNLETVPLLSSELIFEKKKKQNKTKQE